MRLFAGIRFIWQSLKTIVELCSKQTAMQHKFIKPAYRLMAIMFIVIISVMACNSKSEKKEDAMDTANTRPVKTIDNKIVVPDSNMVKDSGTKMQ
jgi:hypothetical protein